MTFAPNFLLSKLAKGLSTEASKYQGRFNLSTLKRINSGGEAVVTSTVKAFFEALNLVRAPGSDDLTVELAAGFGMTETWLVVLVLFILPCTDLFTVLAQSMTAFNVPSPTLERISPPLSFCPSVVETLVWRCALSPLRMVAPPFVTGSLANFSSVAQCCLSSTTTIPPLPSRALLRVAGSGPATSASSRMER